jgi:hypothetical protein
MNANLEGFYAIIAQSTQKNAKQGMYPSICSPTHFSSEIIE